MPDVEIIQGKASDHSKIMRKAIKLALKARYQTYPNPMVGAVLTDGRKRILSEGYHVKAGAPHAEPMALEKFSEVPPDAILYVTMEPCCKYGKTPPCTKVILEKKVRRVVVGCMDPNSDAAGKGIRELKENGVKVLTGVCEKECWDINRVYNKHITRGLPYVIVKVAGSVDGKISMPSGESQWISGEKARAFAHILRSRYQAIAVGANTLKLDNPRLTDRISENPRHPARVVFSRKGEIPMDSYFAESDISPKIIVVGSRATPSTLEKLKKQGIKTLVSDSETPNIAQTMNQLYELGVCSLLLEGGGELVASFIREKMADKIYLCLAGKIIGSSQAPSWCRELGIERLADVPRVTFSETEFVGEDLLISGYFEN